MYVPQVSPDAKIAHLAARQHGVVSIAQLRALGLSEDCVASRVRLGRLHRIHRGVYAVGHRGLSPQGRWKAATLALGEGAALSHRSAAELWALLPERGGIPHVTVPGNGGRERRRGVRVTRSITLTPAMVVARYGIPVTDPERTVTDLTRVATRGEVRKARRQAAFLGLPLGFAELGSPTRSGVEDAFLALCRRHGISKPEANVRIGPYTVDFLWRIRRLVVETDGYGAHRGWQAFQDDRVRDAYLARHGYETLRFSDWQLTHEPKLVVATLRARLGT